MAQNYKPGYICFLRVTGTNIYKFSYTEQAPEKRIPQIKREHSDLNFSKYYYFWCSDINAEENYLKKELKQYEYKGYKERTNFYLFPASMSHQDIIDLVDPRESKTPTSIKTGSDSSGVVIIFIIFCVILASFSRLHSDDKHQKCVNNGGGDACENIKKE